MSALSSEWLNRQTWMKFHYEQPTISKISEANI